MEVENEVGGILSTKMSALTVAPNKQGTCEEVLSSDRKEISLLQNEETALSQVEEKISLLSVKLEETDPPELASLGYNYDGKDNINLDNSVRAIVCVSPTEQVDHARESKHCKSVKRRVTRASREASREQRNKEKQDKIVVDQVVRREKLKRKLEPLGLIINEIMPDGEQKLIQMCKKLGTLNIGDDNEQPRKKANNGTLATQWISIYNARKHMNQRYHYNITDSSLAQHVKRGTEYRLFISCVSSCNNLWAIIMDGGTSFTSQVYKLSPLFLPKEWITEQWKKNYHISALAGSTNGSSLVVMSKGTQFTQQSYKVTESFPFKWINKKWKEGFHITSMATAGTRWAVVMSQNAGYSNQVVELDCVYISEGIHKSWDSSHKITCVAATSKQAALIWSVPRRTPSDEKQETLHTSQFPFAQVKENSKKNLYVSCLCYGKTAS